MLATRASVPVSAISGPNRPLMLTRTVELARSATRELGGAMTTRLLGAALQLAMTVLIAQTHTTGEAAAFFYYWTATRFVGQAVSLGLPEYVMARESVQRGSADLRRVVRTEATFFLGALVLFAAFVVTPLGAGRPRELGLAIVLGTLGRVLTRTASEFHKAHGRAELGLAVEFTLTPAVLCAALVAGLAPQHSPVVHAGAALVIGAIAGWPILAGALAQVQPFEQDDDRSLVASLSIFSLLQMAFLSAPFLLIPLLGGGDIMVAEFGVAQRALAGVSVFFVALGAVYSPQFAKRWAQNDPVGVAALYRRSRYLACGLVAPILVAIVAVPNLTQWVFGDNYAGANGSFVAIMVGQVINAWTGLSTQMLTVTGNARREVRALIAGLAAMVVVALIDVVVSTGIHPGIWFGAAVAIRSLASWHFVREALKNGSS